MANTADLPDDPDTGPQSQGGPMGDRIVLKLRELILDGILPPHQRLAEIPLAERLGVSRTPVRQALGILAKEGLIVAAGARGYVVREFTFKDIVDAIELRGTLEGMAARLAAEARPGPDWLRRLTACIAEGQAVIGKGFLEDGDEARWAEMNLRFHGAILEGSGNAALANAMALNDRLPFASANALPGGRTSEPELMRARHGILSQAQIQHCQILDALEKGQGARVEALMREHALIARSNIVLFRSAIVPLKENEAG